MNKLKVTTTPKGIGQCILNAHDLSDLVDQVNVEITAGNIARVTLVLLPVEIDLTTALTPTK